MRPQPPLPLLLGSQRLETLAPAELRIQHQGRPLRVLYTFDPSRTAILLLGGDKTGNSRWYKVNVPIADRLYEEYLEKVEEGGN